MKLHRYFMFQLTCTYHEIYIKSYPHIDLFCTRETSDCVQQFLLEEKSRSRVIIRGRLCTYM